MVLLLCNPSNIKQEGTLEGNAFVEVETRRAVAPSSEERAVYLPHALIYAGQMVCLR